MVNNSSESARRRICSRSKTKERHEMLLFILNLVGNTESSHWIYRINELKCVIDTLNTLHGHIRVVLGYENDGLRVAYILHFGPNH